MDNNRPPLTLRSAIDNDTLSGYAKLLMTKQLCFAIVNKDGRLIPGTSLAAVMLNLANYRQAQAADRRKGAACRSNTGKTACLRRKC
jgi:hypothetical protein